MMSDNGKDDSHISVWAVLRRIGVDQEWKLAHRVKDNRRDVYSIGRGPDCDIVISDPRVSSLHCLIFCDYSDDGLAMCVSNCSESGTYVNDALIRVRQGERYELKSGDEIFLMNPRYVGYDGGLVSFIFINMRDRLIARKKKTDDHSRMTHTSVEYQRRIEDLYVIGDQIGSGMCGQVHICTHKATRVQCAVKIIDTKKFNKTPGLSAGELRQEAELMRALHHVSWIVCMSVYPPLHRLCCTDIWLCLCFGAAQHNSYPGMSALWPTLAVQLTVCLSACVASRTPSRQRTASTSSWSW